MQGFGNMCSKYSKAPEQEIPNTSQHPADVAYSISCSTLRVIRTDESEGNFN